MNTNSQFPTEGDKQDAISNLTGLKESQYWSFLVDKILEPQIKELEELIFSDDYEGDDKELKIRRKYLKMLTTLPQEAIKELSELEPKEELDPYQQKGSQSSKMKR